MSISVLTFVVGLFPVGIVLGIVGLEIAISIIQAYVFCVLTSSYIKEAVLTH
jgi:F-type H+-transporting ATPase subunit a